MEKEIIDYLKKTQFDIQNAKTGMFAPDLVFQAYVQSSKFHGINFSPVFCSSNNSDFHQIIPIENINNLGEKIIQDHISGKLDFKKIIENTLEREKKIDLIWSKRKDLSKISDRRLIEIYEELLKVSQEWWYYGVMGEDKGRIIAEKLLTIVKKEKISKSEAQERINILAHPKNKSILF